MVRYGHSNLAYCELKRYVHIQEMLREELADKYAIDFWIGLPPSEAHRVARLTAPTMTERLSEIMTDYKVLRYLEAAVKLTYVRLRFLFPTFGLLTINLNFLNFFITTER